MTVDKFTTAPKKDELINKVNEIIDNLGGGGSITVDQTFNGSSANAQSGVAINDELQSYYVPIYSENGIEISSDDNLNLIGATSVNINSNGNTDISGATLSLAGDNFYLDNNSLSFYSNSDNVFTVTSSDSAFYQKDNNNTFQVQTTPTGVYLSQDQSSTGIISVNSNGKLTIGNEVVATQNWVSGQGFITSSDLPTNYVTTNTAQTINAQKTFTGEKAILFKQNENTNKLGFTLYNPSDLELGAFEYRPNTINGNALLNVNTSYSNACYVGFRYWGTAVNVIAPKVATAGNYFIPTHITDGTNTVTASNNGTLNISSLLPDVSNFVTNSSLATTLGDYALLNDDVEFNSVNTQLITFGNELTSISSETDSDSETGASNLIIYGSNISLGADNSINFSGTNFTFNNNEVATQSWVNNQNYQTTNNLVTSISSSSTNTQYPSAKCVYDLIGNIETLLQAV